MTQRTSQVVEEGSRALNKAAHSEKKIDGRNKEFKGLSEFAGATINSVKSSMFGNMNLKEYRHILHPASKLIIGRQLGKTSYQKETMKVDRNKLVKDVMHDYRLTNRKHAYLISQEKFKKMNSQGPYALKPDIVYHFLSETQSYLEQESSSHY